MDEGFKYLHLLVEAKNEIVGLRRTCEILSAQIAVVEVFAAVVGHKKDGLAYGIDVVHNIDQAIRVINMACKLCDGTGTNPEYSGDEEMKQVGVRVCDRCKGSKREPEEQPRVRRRGESVADEICNMTRGCTFNVEDRDRMIEAIHECSHG